MPRGRPLRRPRSFRRCRRRTSRPAWAWEAAAPVAASAPAACRLRHAALLRRRGPAMHPTRSRPRRRTRAAASARARGASASELPARRSTPAGADRARLRVFRVPVRGEAPMGGRDHPAPRSAAPPVRSGPRRPTEQSPARGALQRQPPKQPSRPAVRRSPPHRGPSGPSQEPHRPTRLLCATVCAIAFTVAEVACATAAIVCVTAPLSPGLPTRMEMFEFCG